MNTHGDSEGPEKPAHRPLVMAFFSYINVTVYRLSLGPDQTVQMCRLILACCPPTTGNPLRDTSVY